MKDTLDLLEQALGIEEDLSIEEFITSPEYMGLDSIYAFWINEFRKVPNTTSEIILDGSLGGGKSFLAALYLVYRIVLLFKRGDPCKVLKLAKGSEIYCLYFSVSQTAAKKSGYKYLMNHVDNCKWLRENYPRNKNIQSEIQFKNNFTILSASAEGHQIGLNVWGFLLDEANFREGVGTGAQEQYSETFRLCQQLIDRQITRFSTPQGVNALAIFISSAAYESSFIEERKQSAKNDPNAVIITAVNYKIQPQNYSKEMFTVFFGAGQVEPCIIDSLEQKAGVLSAAQIPAENSDHLFDKVPETLRKVFLENTYLAIQNHCGRPTSMKGTFMNNITLLTSSYFEGLTTPLLVPVITISNKDTSEIMDFIDVKKFINHDFPHSLFLDLSVQGDSGGLTCVRYDGTSNGSRKHTHVFTIEILPPAFPAMTMIRKVYKFIMALSEIVNVTAMGSDQYQSTQIRQDINADLGLDDIRISIDSSDIPHLHWVQALVEERFKMLKIARLDTEIKEAEHDLKRRRVIKRQGSTDDLFQSLVGAFFLSDTVSAAGYDDMGSLYPDGRANLVGGKSITSVLKLLGYQAK